MYCFYVLLLYVYYVYLSRALFFRLSCFSLALCIAFSFLAFIFATLSGVNPDPVLMMIGSNIMKRLGNMKITVSMLMIAPLAIRLHIELMISMFE